MKQPKQPEKQPELVVQETQQVMNGATVPEKGSNPGETKGEKLDSQFPDQNHKPEHKSSHRLLSFKEFVADKFCKFNGKTVEKDAMSGPKAGEKGHKVLDESVNEALTFDQVEEELGKFGASFLENDGYAMIFTTKDENTAKNACNALQSKRVQCEPDGVYVRVLGYNEE